MNARREDPRAVRRALMRSLFRELCSKAGEPGQAPWEVLGDAHERLLSRRVRVEGDLVVEEPDRGRQRATGAVYTPRWIADRVVLRTLGPLAADRDPEALLSLRILDPACGGGRFLESACELLERAILAWCAAHPGDPRAEEHTFGREKQRRLRATSLARILGFCLCGMDIDAQAVEVARMCLALRLAARAAEEGREPERTPLARSCANIRRGDFLASPRSARAGFHAVVGNPPYLEPKRYRASMPDTASRLAAGGAYETVGAGRTDLSLPFLERAAGCLGPGGRLGFIVQSRFFRTEYGASARRWLRSRRLIEEIEDFRDAQIFDGRTTYTAILVLSDGGDAIRYRAFEDHAAARADRPCLERRIPFSAVDDGVWSFDEPDLAEVHEALTRRHGTLGDHREMRMAVGLQVLCGRFYRFEPVASEGALVIGRNGLREDVTLERAALRPLCRNRGFHPLRRNNADAWVLFPYDVEGGAAREIRWFELAERFPRAAAYLARHRSGIEAAVATHPEADRWHLFRYPKNLVELTSPKVLFPSTVLDSAAAWDLTGDVYPDNVRVSALRLTTRDVDLRAVAAVMSSSAFNALARLKAGLSVNGWRQLNRQHAALVPFPLARLRDAARAERLASLAQRIQDRQEAQNVRGLDEMWSRLDAEVEDLFDLTANERAVLARTPRRGRRGA